jgi:hypothetical protein
MPVLKRFAGLFLMAAAAWPQARVASPDGQIVFELIPGAEQLQYRVTFHGRPVVNPSALGFDLQNQPPLVANLKLTAAVPSAGDETYTMPHGKSSPVRNHYNALLAEFEEAGRPGRRLSVEARAYDDGVAFRYLIPEQTALREVRIIQEKTQFDLAKDGDTWPLVVASYRTPYEANYQHVPLGGMVPSWLVALPILTLLNCPAPASSRSPKPRSRIIRACTCRTPPPVRGAFSKPSLRRAPTSRNWPPAARLRCARPGAC